VATAQLPESGAALTVDATPVCSIFPSWVVCKYVSSCSDFVAKSKIHNGHIQKFLFTKEMSSTIMSVFLSSDPHLPGTYQQILGDLQEFHFSISKVPGYRILPVISPSPASNSLPLMEHIQKVPL
jgi:hypothetical protein